MHVKSQGIQCVSTQSSYGFLSPNSSFDSESNRTSSDGDGVQLSIIAGNAQVYLNTTSTRYLSPGADGYYHFAPSYPAHLVPATRLRDCTLAGASIGLALIAGVSPFPLDPSLLLLLAYNMDTACLTRQWMSGFHPEGTATIVAWNEAGPQGGLAPFNSFFASYMNTQVSCLLLAYYFKPAKFVS